MRILRIIHSLSPSVGGPVEGLMQSSRLLTNLGHYIELLSFDLSNKDYIQSCEFITHSFPTSSLRYGWNADFIPWLKSHAHNYDIVLVHGLWLFPTFGTYLALRKSLVPYVVFSHGMLDPWFNRKYPKKYFKKMIYWLLAENWALRKSKAVFFTCEEELRLARTAFPFSNYAGKVIPYGSTRPKEDREECKAMFLKNFPECTESKNFIFVGRLHPKKGCDLLIKAFAKVYLNDDRARLIMVGPDQISWKSELELLAQSLGIESKITWTGLLKGDLKVGAYYASEVFVLPSHQENFGIVVVEAMACGLPVLLSDQVNIWDVVTRDEAGLVAKDDEDGAVSLLKQWRNLSQEKKLDMSQKAESCFEKNYDLETTMGLFAAILKGLTLN